MARVLVVLNPQSRRGGRAPLAVAALRAAGFTPDVQVLGTSFAQDAVAREVERGAPLVVVGGGDGTLSRAVAPLLGSDTALGVLPMGTGNTFARNLGLPLDLEGAARVIASGAPRRVDVGLVNGRPFLNSVSLGLSVQIASALTPALKRRLGWLAYGVAGWQALRARHTFAARLLIDGRPESLFTAQLVIANVMDVADALLVPGADLEDGELVLLSLPGATRSAMLLSALRWRLGDLSAVPSRRFRRARLVLPEGERRANVDGELVERTPLEVRGWRQALKVMVPTSEAGA